MNINYLGSIWLGFKPPNPPVSWPSSQEAKVQYDTGSSWLAVTSSLCDNCDDIAYDLSQTESEKTTKYALEREKFGNSVITG